MLSVSMLHKNTQSGAATCFGHK